MYRRHRRVKHLPRPQAYPKSHPADALPLLAPYFISGYNFGNGNSHAWRNKSKIQNAIRPTKPDKPTSSEVEEASQPSRSPLCPPFLSHKWERKGGIRAVDPLAGSTCDSAILSGCAGSSSASSSNSGGGTAYIENKGSDTIVNLALAWAEQYQKENPDVRVSVTGGGSGTGIAALINGTVDIANASRKIKPEEQKEAEKNGVEPVEFVIAERRDRGDRQPGKSG